MGVKTIFKILIGTTVVLVLSMLVLEVLNIVTYSNQMNQLTRLAVKKACYLFCNETYKTNMGLLEGIENSSGNQILSGSVFQGNTEEEVYNKLYTNSDKFEDWYNDYSAGIWDDLDILAVGLGIGSKALTSDELQLANYYRDSLVTPINLGVTYLDEDILKGIARWNLTALLCNGKREMILTDENGRTYVKYKGFRVYTTEMQIPNIEYKVLDVSTDAGKEEIKKELKIQDTSIVELENNKLLLAGVKYSVPIAYEGITSMAELIGLTSNYRVEGWSDAAVPATSTPMEQLIDDDELESGGLEGPEILDEGGNTVKLPMSGKLTFIITK